MRIHFTIAVLLTLLLIARGPTARAKSVQLRHYRIEYNISENSKNIDINQWLSKFDRVLHRQHYPSIEAAGRDVVVSVSISKDGSYKNAKLVKSSGMIGADRAALVAFKNLGKLDALPEGSPDVIVLKVHFGY